jgi:protein HIRA/HIR1
MDVDMDVPISSLDTSSSVAKGKRKAPPVDLTDDASARPGKARTLGGDRLREVVPVKEISGGGLAGVGRQSWGDVEPAGGGVALPLLPILTCVSVKMEGSEDVFEARNSENDGVLLFCCYFRETFKAV